MQFRDYGEVTPRTITADTPIELDQKIERLGRKYDLIDLQFSTTGHTPNNVVQFSALALVGEKKRKTRKGGR